jgi:phage-related protein
MMPTESHKGLVWMGDSRSRLRDFPDHVREEIGYALYLAEFGDSHPSVKHMQGYNAVEIVADYDGDAYRGVYTTRFQDCIYVLHCFQKKSKRGAATPKSHLSLIKKRLQEAEKHYRASKKNEKNNQNRT